MSVGEVVRIAVVAAIVAALVGGAALVLGVGGPRAFGIGTGALALVLVLLSQRGVAPAAEPVPLDAAPRTGRPDVEQLAWSMVEHRTHIRGIVLARAGAIAARRLAAHGLDPLRPEDAPAIESLVGPTAWAVLRPDRDRPVTPHALDAALSALEHLPPPAPARAISRDRTSRAD